MSTQISPTAQEEQPERTLGCEQAMEIVFAQLLSDAVVAGWREMEVALILADLADDHVLRLARRANAAAGKPK